MIGILRQKIEKLIHGDDGAALVVTLALFMLMYISCAGVFAVGQAVKDKMILQNAADAAAYSAAIVQADTLSRIAVLNREMAWVYKGMVGNQLDYIVCKWLEDACDAYEIDKLKSKNQNSIYASQPYVDHLCMWLRDNDTDSEDSVSSLAEKAEELKGKIESASETISEICDSIDSLVEEYEKRVEQVIEDVLVANLPDRYASDSRFAFRFESPTNWSEIMSASIGNETNFLRFADLSWNGSVGGVDENNDYGVGVTDWFKLETGDQKGFRHTRADPDFFYTKWVWYDSDDVPHPVTHTYNHVEKLAGDSHVNDSIALARPRVLKPDYFNASGVRRGAVSVGVAKYNRNPWVRLVQTGADGKKRGLYEMFQPLIGAIDWTWAVASAQAGYLDRNADVADRAYKADWNVGDQNWNLRTDNFDAVYVPVRQSFGADEFRNWISSAWSALSDSPASDLPAYAPGMMNKPLANMHNGGTATAALQWDSLLNQMYH